MSQAPAVERFRQRVRARHKLVGTFVKTASHQIVEVLATAQLDFIVIDAEHAPFDRQQLDVSVLAARASGVEALVRLPNGSADTVLNVLDIGASGILVPHALDAASARSTLARARYRDGQRGFSNSPRAGGYGAIGMQALADAADRELSVVCQIEDRQAVDRIDEIAAVDGIDCLFIGRADLAVSYGTFDPTHHEVSKAVERVCKACTSAGKTLGIFVGDVSEIGQYEAMGVSLFVVSSDQAMLRAQATSMVRTFRSPKAEPENP